MLLSRLRPAYDRIFAAAVAMILIFYSGFRQSGFDYDEYLSLIDAVRMDPEQSLWEAVFISKEPLFGVAVNLVGRISEEPVFVFLTLGMLAIGSKLVYAFSIRRRATI